MVIHHVIEVMNHVLRAFIIVILVMSDLLDKQVSMLTISCFYLSRLFFRLNLRVLSNNNIADAKEPYYTIIISNKSWLHLDNIVLEDCAQIMADSIAHLQAVFLWLSKHQIFITKL